MNLLLILCCIHPIVLLCSFKYTGAAETGCVDKTFIKEREGFTTTGYVPKDNNGNVLGHSGVTIGNGIDLGSKNEAYFTNLGVKTALINKLKLYFGLQGNAAVTKLTQNPLTLNTSEAEDLSGKVMAHQIKSVKSAYDGAIGSNKKKWDDLTDAQRTVIASVLFQYGSDTRVPTFWKHATNQDWTKVEEELRDFGDKYPTRRGLEADLLKNDDGSNCGKTVTTVAPATTTPAGQYSGKCNSIENINKAGWGGRSPSRAISSLSNKPVKMLFIHHTTGASCNSKTTCSNRAKQTQNFHMNTRGYWDVGYNYLVGEDGRGYEGRGWDKVGGHTYGYNAKAIAISVIGDFTSNKPNDAALNAIKSLIDCAISKGILDKNYELFGHRDAACTACPGNKLYEEIKTWSRYSTRSLQKYNQKKAVKDCGGGSSNSGSGGSSNSGSSSAKCNSIVKINRAGWGASSPKNTLPNLSRKPVRKIFIHHTDGNSCNSKSTCISRVKQIQSFHMNTRKFSDIGYNYLVGEDGNGYEGRGWDKVGGHTYGYNGDAVAISVMGNFNGQKPNEKALKAIKSLIACAIDEGVLDPSYELYGHRDASCTECPGNKLYAEIKTWDKFSTKSIQKYCNKKPWNDGSTSSSSTSGSSGSTSTDGLTSSGPCDKYGDIRKLTPTGASATTAKQDGLSSVGVIASNKLLDKDVNELNKYKSCFYQTGKKYGIHPALIAAIASRESRGGTQLKADGFGRWDPNGYGLLQCDVKTSGLDCKKYGPKSCEHVDMMVKEKLVKDIITVQNKQKAWKKEQQLQGAVAAYNFGTDDVQTWKRLDIGSTGNDYSNDVIARAQRLINRHGWSCTGSTTVIGGPSTTVAPSSGNNCIKMRNAGDCEFYKKCVEDVIPCGPTGYIESYAYKYCTKFGTYYNLFNQDGKDWVDKVRICLMTALYPHTKSPGMTCEKLKDIAFDSHVDCYVKSAKGICYVALNNKLALLKVYDMKDFTGDDAGKAIKQVALTIGQCAIKYPADGIKWIGSEAKDLFDNLKKKVIDLGSTISDTFKGRRKRSTESECKSYAQKGDCRFYECFEDKFSCANVGNYSHIKHFELPNCLEFDRLGISNSKVKTWMQNTQKCLMSQLMPHYEKSSVNCGEVEFLMDEKHTECMVAGGFCPLSSVDEWYVDRGTNTKGFPHIYPVGYYNLPISKGVHMIEKYYYEELGDYKKQIGLANLMCVNQGKRKNKDLYTVVESPRFGRLKIRTEL